MVVRPIPEDGDIVVREAWREGTCVYVLRACPGVDQYLVRTQARAIAEAVSFAKREGACAWLTDGASDLLLLGDFRAAASTGQGVMSAGARTGGRTATAADRAQKQPRSAAAASERAARPV